LIKGAKVPGTSPDHNPSRARRVDAERNRGALIAAARRLFDQRGADVALDEIARAAGVANATLYRHFPTRAELIVAVYAEEVDELGRAGERLGERPDADGALADWLRLFVHHVATKRDLARALPDDQERGAQFTAWHATMHNAAEQLVHRARDAGTVRADVTARDLLALAGAIALTGLPERGLERLLGLIRDGYRTAGDD